MKYLKKIIAFFFDFIKESLKMLLIFTYELRMIIIPIIVLVAIFVYSDFGYYNNR